MTSLQLPKYKTILTSKDSDEALVDIKVEQAEARANLAIAEIKEDLKTRELELKKVCVSKDINFGTLTRLLDEIEAVERRLEQHEEIMSQLFGDE